jgi:hypothetical protein
VHKIRVYVDTSVFGGTQDEEFFVESNNFFEHVRFGEYTVLLSDETLRELANSPVVVQDVWQNLPLDSVELIIIDDEARFLANEYITCCVIQ